MIKNFTLIIYIIFICFNYAFDYINCIILFSRNAAFIIFIMSYPKHDSYIDFYLLYSDPLLSPPFQIDFIVSFCSNLSYHNLSQFMLSSTRACL